MNALFKKETYLQVYSQVHVNIDFIIVFGKHSYVWKYILRKGNESTGDSKADWATLPKTLTVRGENNGGILGTPLLVMVFKSVNVFF